MLLRFFLPALPRSDSRQRAFPAELPKVFLGWCHVRLEQRCQVSGLVPLEGVVHVARFEIDARQLVCRPSGIVELLFSVLGIEGLLIVLRRLSGIARKGI